MGVALDRLPSYGTPKSVTPRIKMVRFGDGYVQRGADGINLYPQKWDVSFDVLTETDAAALEAIFEAAAGGTLDWRPPSPTWNTDPYLHWIVLSWKRVYQDYGINQITAQLEQVFE